MSHAWDPTEPPHGKVVIDTLNHDPARQGSVPEIEAGETPPHLLLQAHLKDSSVVKAFSTVFFRHLADLAVTACGNAPRYREWLPWSPGAPTSSTRSPG